MQDTQKLFQLVQSTATAETLNPVALVCLRFQLPKNEAQGLRALFYRYRGQTHVIFQISSCESGE